jgi:hypothetical protein
MNHCKIESPEAANFDLLQSIRTQITSFILSYFYGSRYRLCGLVVNVPGYRSRGLGSIPGATRFSEVVGLERGPLSLVWIIEELFHGKSDSGPEIRN